MTDERGPRDFRQELTDQLVSMLENGTAPWQKPWDGQALQMPRNPITRHVYRGGNVVGLLMRGFNDPRWMTYRQAQTQGWQVRRGEKGTAIEYWQFQSPDPDRREDNRSANRNQAPLRRIFTVFNAQQIEGVPPLERSETNDRWSDDNGARILETSGASILHDQRDRAFYDRVNDVVHLPDRSAFSSAQNYYSVGLHEVAHWTGANDRLNRDTLTQSRSFGDQQYAREELRAELASLFLAAGCGIPHDPARHASYVSSWIEVLKNDKNEIFRAAKDAANAYDYLHDRSLRHDTFAQEAQARAGRFSIAEIARAETYLERPDVQQTIQERLRDPEVRATLRWQGYASSTDTSLTFVPLGCVAEALRDLRETSGRVQSAPGLVLDVAQRHHLNEVLQDHGLDPRRSSAIVDDNHAGKPLPEVSNVTNLARERSEPDDLQRTASKPDIGEHRNADGVTIPDIIRMETVEHLATFDTKTGAVEIVEKDNESHLAREYAPTSVGGESAMASGRAALDQILDGVVDGRPPTGDTAISNRSAASRVAAQALAATQLGEQARLYDAETLNGRYSGPVIGVTDLHVIQQVTAQAAVLHRIDAERSGILGDLTANPNQPFAINYTQHTATLRELQRPAAQHDFARER